MLQGVYELDLSGPDKCHICMQRSNQCMQCTCSCTAKSRDMSLGKHQMDASNGLLLSCQELTALLVAVVERNKLNHQMHRS